MDATPPVERDYCFPRVLFKDLASIRHGDTWRVEQLRAEDVHLVLEATVIHVLLWEGNRSEILPGDS
jgi:hypothetical protein